MQHRDIWRGVDKLAEKHGISASRLATLAGLDATAFNKSKRVSKDGRLRWPSTESLSRALQAVGEGFSDFADLIDGSRGIPFRVLELHLASSPAHFDSEGQPAGLDWEVLHFPDRELPSGICALEVTNQDLEPIYRLGDRLIVSPQSPIRPKDRLVVKPVREAVFVGEVARKTDTRLSLRSLSSKEMIGSYPIADLAWIARILWVSQ